MTDEDELHGLMAAVEAGAAGEYVGPPVLWDYQDDEHRLFLPPGAEHLLEQVPRKSKRNGGEYYVIPGRHEHTAWLGYVFGDSLQITDDAVRNLRSRDAVGDLTHIPDGLRPDQYDTLTDILNEGGNGILAHDTGLGKTVIAIAWMRALEVEHLRTYVVIAPSGVTHKWAYQELPDWWPTAHVSLVSMDDTKKNREDAVREGIAAGADGPSVIVVHYEALPSLTALRVPWPGVKRTAKQKEPKLIQDLGARFRGIVIDEAHRIANADNVRPMAVGALAAVSDYRLPMSATMVDRASDELWAALDMTDSELVGSRGAYRNVFSHMRKEWHGGLVNVGYNQATLPLGRKIFGPLYHRRSKQELRDAGILPERLPTTYLDIPLTKDQRRQYLQLEDQLMTADPETGDLLIATNGLTRDLYLRMAAFGTITIEDGAVTGLGLPSNKLDALLDLVDEAGDQKLIIATGPFRTAATATAEFLWKKRRKLKLGLMTGGRKDHERHADVRAFQRGELDHMILQTGVGSEGLDMYASSHVVMLMEDWSHRVNEQIIGRADRTGQTAPVNVTVLMSEGTIDYWVRATNERKADLAEVMNQDGLNWEDMRYGPLLTRRVEERA